MRLTNQSRRMPMRREQLTNTMMLLKLCYLRLINALLTGLRILLTRRVLPRRG
jgi:hypothetical protein